MRSIFLSILIAVSATACSWSTFDDLREEAWVGATEKPDNGSTNWGVAIQRGSLVSGSGGRLAVIGTAESIYNEIEYVANGDAKIAANEQELNDQFGIGNLEAQPILLANPTSDEISLITKSGAQQVVVLSGVSGDLTPHQVFGPDTADAAAYMVAPGIDGGATPQPAQPIVASSNVLFGTFFTPPEQPFNQVKCELVEGAAAVPIRALGAVRLNAADTSDDVVVWAASGKLYVIDGQVFNGARSSGICPDTNADGVGTFDTATATQFDVGFGPEVGSQILVFGNRYALLQGHGNSSNLGFLGLVDLMTMTLVGPPNTESGLRSAALRDASGEISVIAGYPNATFEGVDCGEVRVFDVDPTSGIAAAPIEVLRDASPEDGQSYGRAVAAFTYNGQQIIAVAGDNEVFAYFRTSALYADARQGR